MLTSIQTLPIIQSPIFNSFDWLVHGFGIKDITIEQYVKALGLKETQIPKTHQPHGNAVHFLTTKKKTHGPWSIVHGPILEGDAFITMEPGIVCWVRTADCLPILLVDPKHRAVGAVHSGWKGTTEKVVLAAIDAMKKEYKTAPKDLKVALGPAIGGHCYLVQKNVVREFKEAGLYPGPWMDLIDSNKHWFLDIAFANLYLLETAGVSREQVYLSLACTACDLERFHSFRKEGEKKGEQVSFILVR